MKKKVFIVHSSDDAVNVKKYFIDVLEAECGVECIYDQKDFNIGKETVANIADAIKQCHKTFVILTPSSLTKNWVKYEMLLALEKSQRSSHLCITLFLFKVDQEAVQGQLFGVLSDAMMVMVNPNKDHWQETLKQDMLTKINEDSSMCHVNIAANMSVGQAWSHFTGYGRIVLPNLRDRITNSKWFLENPDQFPIVEFNLIPNNAKTVQSLEHLDQRIKLEGHLESIISGRGSFADRPYNISVYSITDGGEVYYFVGQIPNTLSILSKLENLDCSQHDNNSRQPHLRMTRGERSLQVARFAFIYNRLVNHPHSRECNNMVVLLQYNESENPGDILLKAIKDWLGKAEASSNAALDTTGRQTFAAQKHTNTETNTCMSAKDFNRSVYIDCLDTCQEDVKTKYELEQFLEENGLIVWKGSVAGTHQQILEKAVTKCKWAIFVLSEKAIKDPDFSLLQWKFRGVLTKSVEENEVRVIPFADGIKEDKISQDMRALTYLSKQEPDYKKRLLQTIRCESIPMECPVIAEGVHEGLAWTYVYNYLCVTLKGRSEQFRLIEKNNPSCTVYKKMFIVIPSSCAVKSLSALDMDERGQLIDPNFQQMQDIHYNLENVGGVVGRPYQLITYKITTPTKNYIVAVEYPNAVLCLQEMSDLQAVSGLARENLHDEAWQFQELAQDIVDNSPVAKLAKFLYYDDSKWTVAEAMLEILQQEDQK